LWNLITGTATVPARTSAPSAATPTAIPAWLGRLLEVDAGDDVDVVVGQ
jgi:hypothetical protein